MPDKSVSHPGSGREVDGNLDGIISIISGSLHPGRSSLVAERNNSNLLPVTTMTGVTNTTTTTTQSRGTVPGLRSSLSPVMTTSSHGALPGGLPSLSSNPVPSAMSSSPMVTTCSATSHSSTTQTYVSSPSVGSIPVLVPNVSDAFARNLIDAVKGVATKQETSICPDVSLHSKSSDLNLAANRQLAWAQIKADTRAERFDGRDAAFYQTWRKALEAEVQQLSPPPESCIQIIDLRTTGEAKEMVKSVKEMVIENPQEALDLIWENFECRYKSNPQSARKLLAKLRGFSDVSTRKIDELWTFALACRQATTLMSIPQVERFKLPRHATYGGGMPVLHPSRQVGLSCDADGRRYLQCSL